MTVRARPPASRFAAAAAALGPSLLLAGCTSVGLGVSLLFPGGRVGVGVDGSGRVGGGVSVGSGPASVGVGGTAQLPPPAPSEPASTASAAPAGP